MSPERLAATLPIVDAAEQAERRLALGFPSLQSQCEYWLKKEQEWVGCNGGENDWRWEEEQHSNYEGWEL